jgi:transcriptional activator HAC1
MNHETVSSMEFCEPTTICLAETSLLTPEASHFVKEQSGTPSPEDKKPAKKRKSWGQELPTPKTNLPPR